MIHRGSETARIDLMGKCSSSHNHGSEKWIPSILVSFIVIFNFHDYGRKSR